MPSVEGPTAWKGRGKTRATAGRAVRGRRANGGELAMIATPAERRAKIQAVIAAGRQRVKR